MDIAGAFDLCLDADQEAKFLALKALQAKKVKALMSSIDAKDKEIASMKVLAKDHRRTQMIQGYRNKIRDMELCADVLKEELRLRTNSETGALMTAEQVCVCVCGYVCVCVWR